MPTTDGVRLRLRPLSNKKPPINTSKKMAALISRVWSAFSPPQVAKKEGALKFGVLGAASIA
ncbi:hypothetical protein E4T52_05737 [Aureobasidium sp. EXF-3400]|nr:hypothetical protein E4T51_04905 [Aureobasidium sp. EXF-12344]KAI4779331.1 hypothetical protein E4T52_05737 [Aureobasidium sp. EXF-3400]